jgi:hypothetical protein
MATVNHRRRGFMFIDAVMGLLILAGLVATLAVSIQQHRKAQAALANDRAAVRLAERVLTAVQTEGSAESVTADGARIEIIKPVDGWLLVRVRISNRTAELFGPARGAQ